MYVIFNKKNGEKNMAKLQLTNLCCHKMIIKSVICVYDKDIDNFFFLLVLKDKETGKPFVEYKGKKYFEEDIT